MISNDSGLALTAAEPGLYSQTSRINHKDHQVSRMDAPE